jgi:hypothetical protein
MTAAGVGRELAEKLLAEPAWLYDRGQRVVVTSECPEIQGAVIERLPETETRRQ